MHSFYFFSSFLFIKHSLLFVSYLLVFLYIFRFATFISTDTQFQHSDRLISTEVNQTGGTNRTNILSSFIAVLLSSLRVTQFALSRQHYFNDATPAFGKWFITAASEANFCPWRGYFHSARQTDQTASVV